MKIRAMKPSSPAERASSASMASACSRNLDLGDLRVARGSHMAISAPSPELEKAERLARIIVSDIVLYNQEKFDAAIGTGNVLEALAAELAEGHALFSGRVDPSVGDAQELLGRELLRIARSRGMN